MRFFKYVKTMLYGYIALILAIESVIEQSLVAKCILALASLLSIWIYGKKVDKYIRYNEETQSCEEINADASYNCVKQITGKIAVCNGDEMLRKIEVDNSGLITRCANFVNYVYLADTSIVYFTGFDSEFPNAITPFISKNGNYVRYNEETHSCEEVGFTFDKNAYLKDYLSILPEASVKECKTKEDCDALLEQVGLSKPLT